MPVLIEKVLTDNKYRCDYSCDVAKRAKTASLRLATATGSQKDDFLRYCAAAIRQHTDEVLTANQQDLEQAPQFGLTPAQCDRLKLTPERIEVMAKSMEEIIALPNPVGRVIDSNIRPNGLVVNKVRVPLGVIFFIYESRPNVTADAAAICVKSGNAVILRGGKEAIHSNMAIARLFGDAAIRAGLPADIVQLIDTPDRQVVSELLGMSEYITVTIPRGGEGLIRTVCEQATMPVLKHFAGNCHIYIDSSADAPMAVDIVINAKCQRPGVCNAAESLVIHRSVVPTILPQLATSLTQRGVEIRGDEATCTVVSEAKPATEADFRTEFLGPIISVKVVDTLEEAIDHINRYGDGHTEAIITSDLTAAQQFTAGVDSSAVMVNASTRFNDGGCFGLGAEIGISTDKFHARGPCGLEELTTYKYVVFGQGHIRE